MIAFAIADGQIAGLFNQANPAKLGQLPTGELADFQPPVGQPTSWPAVGLSGSPDGWPVAILFASCH